MEALQNLVQLALSVYSIGLIIYIFMSWVPGARESPFGEMLGSIAEPYLEQFRRFIPPIGMIDISPIIAIITLRFAQQGVSVLFSYLM